MPPTVLGNPGSHSNSTVKSFENVNLGILTSPRTDEITHQTNKTKPGRGLKINLGSQDESVAKAGFEFRLFL